MTKPAKSVLEIEFKRGRRDETITSDRMTWTSRCGQYQVQECKNRYEKRTVYYALILQNGKFHMLEHLKTFRTRKAAERALVTHFKKQAATPPPKPKRTRKRKVEDD